MTATVSETIQSDAPRRRLLTVDEFDCAWAQGVYGPEERLELIEGEVIEKVTPQESPHATGVRLSDRAMNRIFVEGYDVRTQLPLVFGPRNKPEPDVAVVTGEIRDYSRAHPTTAVLIIEVSDTTLRYDRMTKAGLYARAGIADYWILNLVDRVLEVHREPAAMTDMPLGHGYRSVLRYTPSDSIAPLVAPQSLIAVADLLP
jgi:Uma2 family endonuclease